MTPNHVHKTATCSRAKAELWPKGDSTPSGFTVYDGVERLRTGIVSDLTPSCSGKTTPHVPFDVVPLTH
ncbi:hypothetical protein CH063_11890 [Colletotrichum higginsianum]|uniref:Uncharacterized protein n=1 Tax=Colletotrichum higginsianum (strain IMI 349063) TaxID=759273 RepID=H1VN74_COLHI|nr:hypothetical protein CH063_11890 [Colletotrichum higginsianum]